MKKSSDEENAKNKLAEQVLKNEKKELLNNFIAKVDDNDVKNKEIYDLKHKLQ